MALQVPARFRYFLPSPPDAIPGIVVMPPALGAEDPRFTVGKPSVIALVPSYMSPVHKLTHSTKFTPSNYSDTRVVPIMERHKRRDQQAIFAALTIGETSKRVNNSD